MRHLILFYLAMQFASLLCGQCAYKTNVPKEYYRGRYEPVEADISYPFTLFNKRKTGWTLNTALTNIRNNIKAQIAGGQYRYPYTTFDRKTDCLLMKL